MPVPDYVVEVKLKEDEVSTDGEISIVFPEGVEDFDAEQIDQGVLELYTRPAFDLAWTASYSDRELLLKIEFTNSDQLNAYAE